MSVGGPVCRRVGRDGCTNFAVAYHLMRTVKWRLVFENFTKMWQSAHKMQFNITVFDISVYIRIFRGDNGQLI